jgi:hypothetical protein
MRKSIIASDGGTPAKISDNWRELERIARVEITSEDPAFPIEQALGKALTEGWRAATTGPQVIRMHFDEPMTIRRIQLRFVERAVERTQEFLLLAGVGTELREVMRQQWTFSPQGTVEELEDYAVDLHGVTVVELRIDPDRSHDPAASQSYASLQSVRIA